MAREVLKVPGVSAGREGGGGRQGYRDRRVTPGSQDPRDRMVNRALRDLRDPQVSQGLPGPLGWTARMESLDLLESEDHRGNQVTLVPLVLLGWSGP